LKVSVASVMMSYNGKGLLSEHVNSQLAQKRPMDEIIVVASGSSGTSGFLAEHYPQVKVVRLDVKAALPVGGPRECGTRRLGAGTNGFCALTDR
jgi:hypothetical protein